jgi:4-amino-4-deoxy-L-arabinose transferase-like glycosyltransferase
VVPSSQAGLTATDAGVGRTTLQAFATGPVAVVVAVLAAVQTALAGRYGYHRDELYFLVAGDHPAAGYVDQPPLTPLLARAGTELFGDTLIGLRIVAILAYMAIVIVVALIARELGADRQAQTLAAVCGAVSGIVLVIGHMVSTATFDMLIWLLVSWFVLRLLRTGDGRWYLAIGAAVGVGMQNKYLILLLVFGLPASVLAVGPRRVLVTPWLAAGALIALAIALPNLWWQAAHGWPQLTVAGGISSKDGLENRLMFVPLQLVYVSPPFVPILVAGLLRLWRAPEIRWARAIAVAYPLLAVVVLAIGGKPYYVLPLLIVVLAAGAEPTVRWAHSVRRRTILAAVIAVSALVNAVATLPLLPPSVVGVVNAMNKEQGEQVGWPSLVQTVATVWERIPADQRERAVIFTQNYGEAGAIDKYRSAYGLPSAYSGHMSYADWGPPADSSDGPVILVHYPSNRAMARYFRDCSPVARVDNGYGLANDEQGTVIQLCAGTAGPWSSVWASLRHYY